jgi:hypothetical protein
LDPYIAFELVQSLQGVFMFVKAALEASHGEARSLARLFRHGGGGELEIRSAAAGEEFTCF